MGIQIEPYSPQHIPAVRSFNARLAAQDVREFRLSEGVPRAARPDLPVDKREYLALDDGEVRGGFMLQEQQFWISGQTMRIGNCQLPISEGMFNPVYANLGLTLLRHALRVHPRLFCLGMGSRQNRLPKMLSAMGWILTDIPFLFRVSRPARFLRNITALRRTATRRLLMDIMAFSGAGGLGIRVMQARRSAVPSVAVEALGAFETWADALWDQCKPHLSMSAVRTSAMLNLLHTTTGDRSFTLRMTRDGTVVGWVALRDTQMHDHRYFGNLRVGTLVDGLALPEAIPDVIGAATRVLEERGVDLTISNQGHQSWVRGLRRCGFLTGPSNYILALSPTLAAQLEPLTMHRARLHINRGDGDGPLDL